MTEEKVNLRILFFAKAKDLIGITNGYLSLNRRNLTGHELMNLLIENYPKQVI
jgi:hypothetical protein